MKNKINYNKLRYGQKVWCIQFGYCNVCETNYTDIDYPITVKKISKKESFYETFTANGRTHKDDKFPSLFLEKPSFISDSRVITGY